MLKMPALKSFYGDHDHIIVFFFNSVDKPNISCFRSPPMQYHSFLSIVLDSLFYKFSDYFIHFASHFSSKAYLKNVFTLGEARVRLK